MCWAQRWTLRLEHAAAARRRAHEGAALEHECPGSPGNGTGGTAGRSSGGRPNAWQNAVLPHLLSLQTLLPSESSMVFRALQLVHERRLTLLVGDKPSESSSRASGHAEAAQRWQEQTIRAEARPQAHGWASAGSGRTYFSIESERRAAHPTHAFCPVWWTRARGPLRIRSQSTADHEPSISKLNSMLVPQGLCTCIEFQERQRGRRRRARVHSILQTSSCSATLAAASLGRAKSEACNERQPWVVVGILRDVSSGRDCVEE